MMGSDGKQYKHKFFPEAFNCLKLALLSINEKIDHSVMAAAQKNSRLYSTADKVQGGVKQFVGSTSS